MPDILLPALGCTVVLLVTMLTDVRGLWGCAMLFVAGWLFYISAWVPKSPDWYWNSPSQMLWMLTGAAVQPERLWAVADLLIGTTILRVSRQAWWGLCLFSLYFVQVILHSVHAAGWEFNGYAMALNNSFWAQIAVFLLAGGRHAVSLILSHTDGGGRRSLCTDHATLRASSSARSGQESPQ